MSDVAKRRLMVALRATAALACGMTAGGFIAMNRPGWTLLWLAVGALNVYHAVVEVAS